MRAGGLIDGYSQLCTAWRRTRGLGGGPGGFGGGPGGFGGGPGGRGGNNTGSHLLTLTEDPAVWDEIKITDEQLGKVTRLRSSISKSSRAFRNKIRADQQAERDLQQQQAAASGQQVDQAARNAARDAQRQLERAATTENDVAAPTGYRCVAQEDPQQARGDGQPVRASPANRPPGGRTAGRRQA